MNMTLAQIKLSNKIQSNRTQREILWHYIWHTLPLVKKELRRWKQEALACADPALSLQAVNSISNKDFHCYGGAVYAIAGAQQEKLLIRLIVAYQTICDYLDNLCDRNDCLDGGAFRQLHIALQDALQPGTMKSNYYQYYPNQDDGGYLDKLVEECRTLVQKLPAYPAVQKEGLDLVQYYIDLQVKKHISLSQRERTLIDWAENNLASYPGIYWQEFAAASGSTLALFALLALASHNNIEPQECRETIDAYFPWICGLHILLDYFIDQEEDRQGGDLNFTFYYADHEETLQRLMLFIQQSHMKARQIKNAVFAKTVIEGLLALYLSDSKIKSQGYQKMARCLMAESGPSALHTYRLCSLVRRFF